MTALGHKQTSSPILAQCPVPELKRILGGPRNERIFSHVTLCSLSSIADVQMVEYPMRREVAKSGRSRSLEKIQLSKNIMTLLSAGRDSATAHGGAICRIHQNLDKRIIRIINKLPSYPNIFVKLASKLTRLC
jgi:hypothetical protein